eukprot:scaffold67790_cov24-Tisochrysis_lutea.AAC.2
MAVRGLWTGMYTSPPPVAGGRDHLRDWPGVTGLKPCSRRFFSVGVRCVGEPRPERMLKPGTRSRHASRVGDRGVVDGKVDSKPLGLRFSQRSGSGEERCGLEAASGIDRRLESKCFTTGLPYLLSTDHFEPPRASRSDASLAHILIRDPSVRGRVTRIGEVPEISLDGWRCRRS